MKRLGIVSVNALTPAEFAKITAAKNFLLSNDDKLDNGKRMAMIGGEIYEQQPKRTHP